MSIKVVTTRQTMQLMSDWRCPYALWKVMQQVLYLGSVESLVMSSVSSQEMETWHTAKTGIVSFMSHHCVGDVLMGLVYFFRKHSCMAWWSLLAALAPCVVFKQVWYNISCELQAQLCSHREFRRCSILHTEHENVFWVPRNGFTRHLDMAIFHKVCRWSLNVWKGWLSLLYFLSSVFPLLFCLVYLSVCL